MSQDNRLTPAYFPYDARMCFEIALGLEPLEKIIESYGLTRDDFAKLSRNPQFRNQILEFKKEIKDKGLSFKAKAKMMAEDLLTTAYDIIHHSATTASVKADLIKWTAKVAGYEAEASGGLAAQTQSLLPAIQQTIKDLSTGDLEIQVMQIVKRRQERELNPATEVDPLQLH